MRARFTKPADLRRPAVLLLLLSVSFSLSAADDMTFNWDIISREMGMDMDPEMFAEMQREMALGLHPYDIYINNTFAGEQTVEVYLSELDETSLLVALPASVFQKLPLKRDPLEALFDLPPDERIRDYEQYIPGVSVELDDSFQFVRVKIPQIYEDTRQRTYMPTAVWNYGEPAMKFHYNADLSYRDERWAGDATRGFFSGQWQLNLGRWRLKAQGTAEKQSDSAWSREIYDRHASTLIPSLGAELRVGEFNSRSSYLNSLPIVGVNLYEDGNQVEPMEREYLPVITGFANSSAVVTVRQDGRVLREVDVSGGPFEFNDIRAIGSSGDIEVEVKEYGGKTSVFIVPFTSDQKLLKDGRLTWSTAIGRYDDKNASEHPWVMEASGGYGMPVGGWTLYGGTIQSEIFQQYMVGSAFDVGRWGALALQLEESAVSRGEKRRGRVAEFSWNKYFELSESDFSLRYRHTMDGSIGSLGEALLRAEIVDGGFTLLPEDFIEDEVSVTLSKTTARLGTFSGSAFWQQSRQGNRMETLNASWSFNLAGCSAQLQAQGSRQETAVLEDEVDWTIAFRIDIPLASFGLLTSSPFNKIGLSTSQRSHGDYAHQVDFSTNLGERNDWQFDVSVSDGKTTETNLNSSLGYNGSLGNVTVSGGYSRDAKSAGLNLSGAVLATRHGVMLSNNLNGNTVLVHVPDAPEASVSHSGRAGEWVVLSGFSDFVANPVTLDPDSLPPNVTVVGGYEKEVIPANDAVIAVEFVTFAGEQAVFSIVKASGEPLPYGALVSVLDVPVSLEPSVTDESGQAYFTSAPKKGTLEAKWREEGEIRSCRIPYELVGTLADEYDMYQETLVCKPEGASLRTDIPSREALPDALPEELHEDVDDTLQESFSID